MRRGVNAFSKSLAVELAPHKIRVNVVSPSLVRSEIYFPDGMDRETYDALLKASAAGYYPLGRAGEPADIAPSRRHTPSAGGCNDRSGSNRC